MSGMIGRITYAMGTYHLEEAVDGTFFIQHSYDDHVVRDGLTANDEPNDIVDRMNAVAVLEAMREPTEAMNEAAGDNDPLANYDPKYTGSGAWEVMIDAALAETTI